MKLILVRHGESAVNVGKVDVNNNLTARGKEQAKKAAKYLMDENIDQIYCSNTKRCIETLDEIIKGRTDCREISLSKLISPKKKTENLEELKKRINLFVEDLKIDFDQETVMIISHQWTIRMIVFLLTGENIGVENGSVSIFEISDQVVRKIMVNERGI